MPKKDEMDNYIRKGNFHFHNGMTFVAVFLQEQLI